MAIAVAQCDANTGSVPADTGWQFVRCETRIGLSSYTDANGTVRRFCGAPGHERNVRRRFGAPGACYLCGKPADDMAITVNLGLERLGLMCSYCQDDLEPLVTHG